ncbi:hypothetical protein QBC47DRAFT_390017 [Echria macrotheca]|uniref:Uncharacterized protein n=1 Tax=Echria macrotheca TaxID=438768 RepID=A0AAJ0F2C9_9PEZI|nr:hypothetical protein QBC47DRAFT_390017 [Echria macrotheca]
MDHQLPELTSRPTRHPQSCASISRPLLSFLNSVLPNPPHLTLSIGSGPGLLEALLLHHHPSRAGTEPVSFLGVEVSTTAPGSTRPVNRFLPEQNAATVGGTWALAATQAVEEAAGLVFVYPRDGELIRRYLDAGRRVEVVVWVGPRCDLDSMTGPLRDWGVEVPVPEGMVEEGEGVVVFRRRDG